MKKVLLSCIALAAGTAMAIAQDDPVYPSALDFTLNGEKELTGVSVSQTMGKESLLIEIKGESDASVITMDFELPEGWDYALIGSLIGDEGNPFKTRSSHWLPVSTATQQGYKKGSSFKFPADGKKSYGTIFLVKGDNVWDTPIDIEFNVTNSGSADDPIADDPTFPENFKVETFNDGLEVKQGLEYGVYEITVTGEVAEATFPIVIDIPEGWDGFLCYNWSHEGDVTITESNPSQKSTRADEIEWVSVESLLAKGYVKGNRYTFEPTFVPEYNNSQTVEIHLYKGDMAMEEYFNLDVSVTKGETEMPELPTYPETFDLTIDSDNVTIWQGSYEDISESGVELTEDEMDALSMFMPEKAIVLNGTTENGSLTVNFDLPEGWAGVLPVKVNTSDENEDVNPLTTRANAFEPYSMEEFLGMMQWMSMFDVSIAPGKQLVFPLESQKQIFGCYLYIHDDGTYSGSPEYAGDYLDAANSFVIVINVKTDGESSDFEYPEHLDMTLNGETSLPGVTVTQELIPYDGNDYLTISVTGTYDANEITIDMTTPEGWDGMLTFTDYGEEEDEIEPLRVKVNMDEDSWIPLMFASWMGLTESNTLTFSVDGKEHNGMVYLVKGDNYYAVNIDFIFEVSKTGGSAVEGVDAIVNNAKYYDMNGNEIAKPAKGIYVKVANGKASKVIVK